jgi:hypothetical protein
MATLQDIANAVQAETTIDGSIVALLSNISTELKTAIANNDPAAMATILAEVTSNSKMISDAVTANTPAAPTAIPAVA